MPIPNPTENENKTIKIVFEDFRLEKSENCANDWIQIKDSSDEFVLSRACGDIYDLAKMEDVKDLGKMTVIDVSVDRAPLDVTFNTDDSDTDKGFKFSWYIGEKEGSEANISDTSKPEYNKKFCGGTLTEMDCCGADQDRQCGYGQGDCDADEECAPGLRLVTAFIMGRRAQCTDSLA